MDARETALLTLNACERQGGWSDGALKKQISAAGLDSRDAALATQLCAGVLQNQMLLDFYLAHFSNIPLKRMEGRVVQALRLGAYQMLFLDRIPHSAAVNRSVELTRAYCKNPRAAGMVNGILRSLERSLERLPTIPQRDPVEYLSILYSHPAWMVREFLLTLGNDGAAALLRANNAQPATAAQVNTLKINARELRLRLEERGVRAETPLADRLYPPVWDRESGGAAGVSGGSLLHPGPSFPAGGGGSRPCRGDAGAGCLRGARRQVLCRSYRHGGQGNGVLLRPAPPQEKADRQRRGPSGPGLRHAYDGGCLRPPPGVGGCL